MSELPKSQTKRSEFLRILSQELLKVQNDCTFELLQYVDIEQLYQHYLNQTLEAKEFAVRFAGQLNNACSTHSSVAFASLLTRRHRTSITGHIPMISALQNLKLIKRDKKIPELS